MPLIPQDTKRIPIEGKGPAEVQNPEWFGVTGRAIAQAGAVGEKIGEKLNELDVAMTKAQITNDIYTAKKEIAVSSINLKNALKDNPNEGTFPDIVSKFQEETSKGMEKYAWSPRLKSYVDATLQEEFEKQNLYANDLGRRLKIDRQKGDLVANSNFLLQQSSAALDPQEANFYKAEHDQMLNSYVCSGIIGADDAEKARITFDHTSALSRAETVATTAPDRWLKMSESEINDMFPGLTQINKIQISKAANSALFEHKAALNAATATSIMGSLDRTYKMPDGTFDYEAVNKLINDPDWRDKNKVDVSIEATLRQRYAARQQEDKRVESANEEKQLEPVYNFISKGQFSSALVALDKTSLSAADKMKWNRAIDAEIRTNRTEARIAAADKSDEIAGQILGKIQSGEPVDLKTDIFDKVGKGGLSFETSFRIASMIDKAKKDPNYKLGYDVIDKTLKFDPIARGKALIDYGDVFNGEMATMTGKRAVEIAEGIVKPKKENAVKDLINKLFTNFQPASKNPMPTAERAGGVDFGNRTDGTPKANGFLGVLKRPDGKVSTELSMGVNFDGKEQLIPTLVPTLNKTEVDYLLAGKYPTKEIMDKAVAHARKRISAGKSPFATNEESSKFMGFSNGKPVFDLGGGKWQVGD